VAKWVGVLDRALPWLRQLPSPDEQAQVIPDAVPDFAAYAALTPSLRVRGCRPGLTGCQLSCWHRFPWYPPTSPCIG
jgi:hypothetical protein